MTDTLLGQTLGERYRFEELLGEGSFAQVYRITDLRRAAVLAAKVLRRDIAQDTAFLERFRREAEVLDRLQHPNIVRYYDTEELDSHIFILMDYIPGTTLETVLVNAAGSLKPSTALTYLTPLASALHFAHYEGVIHRDLKPANILLHDNGTLYITDFGIARILNVTSELTLGISLGTPFYMAPEQITGGPITVATDIYALGIILYRMVTGVVPFRGEHPGSSGSSTAARTTYEHVHLKPPPPANVNPNLDLAVQDIILRCLEKNPARRYRTVSELYDDLTEAIGAPPLSLGPALPEDSDLMPPRPPEWSQFMAQVEHQKPVPRPKTPPLGKIEHPVPLPATEPHLEKQLRAGSRPATPPRTMPSVGRVAAPYVPDYTAPIYPPPRRFNWITLSAFIGALLVVGVFCLAVVYLYAFSGSDNSENPTQPPATTPIASLDASATPAAGRGGIQIAFDSERSGDLDIYIMDVDGSHFRQLTGTSGAERGPAWSPDGSQIAYYGAATKNGNYDIFIINVDGTGLINLTNTPEVDEKYPTWSPDGIQLAFHSNLDGDYDLYLINRDGTGLRAITTNDDDDLGPDWSPEGTQIVFHTDAWDKQYEIAILNLTTGQVRRLTDSDDNNTFPTWSPDGKQIAYNVISSLNGSVNIYILNMDTGASRQLTTGPQNAFPDWSPDGASIIYQSGQPDVSAIAMIPVAGGTPQTLTGTQSNFLPEWEPAY
jgi:serine/threonine protein kinase/Tol biopolymer transport system component